MNIETKAKIKQLILDIVNKKLSSYQQESEHKPFFEAIFSKEDIYTASILQSFYTSFGMSVYEQIALILAHAQGWHAERQYPLHGSINDDVVLLIEKICLSQSEGKQLETEKIRQLIKSDAAKAHPDSTVDVFIRKNDGTEIYVDITSVKPNLKEFRSLRRKMLIWAALRLSQNAKANVNTYIGIPYNPYHPEAYLRWTGNENDPKEVLVQEDLWNTFAGYEVYPELIATFQEAGKEIKEKVSAFVRQKTK